jgi:hypothetical protein
MSGQLKLKAASLGGDITLTPTDTASNLVVTIPAGTSTLVTNATLPAQLNASGSAPIYACRAWVNFDGTGTITIRGSGNVSSITDNGPGNYTVNFTTIMPDSFYSVSGFGTDSDGVGGDISFLRYASDTYTSSAVQVRLAFSSIGYDGNSVSVQIFR